MNTGLDPLIELPSDKESRLAYRQRTPTMHAYSPKYTCRLPPSTHADVPKVHMPNRWKSACRIGPSWPRVGQWSVRHRTLPSPVPILSHSSTARRLEAYIAESMEEAEDIRSANEVEARLEAGTESVHEHEAVWREIAAPEASKGVPAPFSPLPVPSPPVQGRSSSRDRPRRRA